MSLFMTWDHNYLSTLDHDLFLAAMARGDTQSPYCSRLLVNSILAYACVSTLICLPVMLRSLLRLIQVSTGAFSLLSSPSHSAFAVTEERNRFATLMTKKLWE